jgi:hypothetical protein
MAVTLMREAGPRRDAARCGMAEIEAAAAAPNPGNDQLYVRLLDQVVDELVARGAEPTEALGAAGRAVKGTPWAGYRNGRARLASAAATYLTWLVPGNSWTHFDAGEVEGRRPVGWQSAGGETVVDVLGGGRANTGIVRQVRDLHPEAAVIRVLDLLAPRRSVAYPKGAPPVQLVDTPWWFEGAGR